jgi:hypothetical protein
MTKKDWIEVGLRVLGAYFLITGIVALEQVILTLSYRPSGVKATAELPGAEMFLIPLTQIVAGILLCMGEWPGDRGPRKVQGTARPTAPVPAHLAESFDQMEGRNA